MNDTSFYRIAFEPIVGLPEGRERTILARKALAAFLGLASTPSLKTYDAYDPENAVAALKGRISKGAASVGIPVGYEPTDPSDRSRMPVSIEQFMAQIEGAGQTRH